MATWEEIKSFIQDKYSHVEQVNDNVLKGLFHWDESGRDHLFFCERINDTKIAFVAPVAKYTPENAIKLLENNSSVFGIDLRGDPPLLCLVDPQEMATLDEEEINVAMVMTADKLEQELFGGNEF